MAGIGNVQEFRVSVDQLRVGVFIRLEMAWFEHPFLFGSFKIKSIDQIATLKELGLTSVLFIPEKSDQLPVPQAPKSQTQGEAPPAEKIVTTEALWNIKQERIATLRAQRERFCRCEKQYRKTLDRVRNIMNNLTTASAEVVKEASSLVEEMVQIFVSDKDIVVHLMNTEDGTEDLFYHSLNTAVLGLIVGREYGLEAESLNKLGLGLLFHDIGKQRIPKRVLIKKPPLTPSELKLVQLHTRYGEDMIAGQVPDFPAESLEIIGQHHETADGKGYPAGLKEEQIPLLVKLAAVVNTYDNHCNKVDPESSLTPYQALSYMFGKQNKQFPIELVALLVRSVGVYPPGALVQLSNGSIGLVVSVNPTHSLRPGVLLYDPTIPKNEALIIELEDEPDLSIVQSIHPASVSTEIYNYLSPRNRVIYFSEPSTSSSN
jgi:HD-GYP domain-containing protein (c-di-GMP phosphodiesterase class II)